MLKKIISVVSRLTKGVIQAGVITCACLPQTRASDRLLLDKIIATVNEELILHSDLEGLCSQYSLENKVINDDQKMVLLRNLILNKMLVAKASLHEVKIPKDRIQKECDNKVNKWIRQLGSQKKLVEVMGQPIYQIKENLKKQAKEEFLAAWVYQNLTQQVVVTPAELKAYFNARPAYDRPYYPTSVQVHQIVLYPKIDSARHEAVKSKLLHLKQLLLEGQVTFAELAKQHSDDLDSAAQGGEIGWKSLGALSPAYEAAALALKIGQISDPITSEFGLHLIELIGRNKDQYNTRHILQTIQPTKEEINLAEVELNQIREQIVSGRLTFEKAIEQYSEDKETALREGLITRWEKGELLTSPLLSVEELDPNVYFAIDGLDAGSVSKPQYIDKSYKPAWYLFYVKQKVEAHPMNLTQDYEKIHDDLLNQKKNEIIHKWIKTAKSEFVISFAPEYGSVENLL